MSDNCGVVHRNPYLVQLANSENIVSVHDNNNIEHAEAYHTELCNILSFCLAQMQDEGWNGTVEEVRSRVRNLRHENGG